MNPLDLSIVLPTRNRPASLKFALESIYSRLNLVNCEVIISSNGNSLEGDLQGIPSHLLRSAKIVRSQTRLSMGDNWRFGFKYAKGKWIYIMGDDDCISLKSPDKLNDLLSRDDIDGLLFKFGIFKWEIDSEGNYYQASLQEPEESFAIVDGNKLEPLLKDWEKIQPQKYPNSSGRSLIKRDFLCQLDLRDSLFSAVSPDWFTGAYFAFTNSKYLVCDLLWANIGIHPESSVAQMHNPQSEVALEEAKVQRYEIHPKLNTSSNAFPTTWLARIDSLIRAREILGLSTEISSFRLIRSALETTPRFVHKVAIKLVSDRYSRTPLVLLLIIPAYVESLWKKINP